MDSNHVLTKQDIKQAIKYINNNINQLKPLIFNGYITCEEKRQFKETLNYLKIAKIALNKLLADYA